MSDQENNSGKGKGFQIPEGIDRWSWGPCLLSWIWALGNKTWIGLLALLPYAGIVMVIILGFKGRAWAWQNKKWDSVEHFNRVQRKWTIGGVSIVAGFFVLWLVMTILISIL